MSWRMVVFTGLVVSMLIAACSPSPAASTSEPVAAFRVEVEAGSAPHTATFIDQSENAPTGWAWDFGDGVTSTEQSPTHTYEQSGSFDVTLVATNGVGKDRYTAPGLIAVTPGQLARLELSTDLDSITAGGEHRFDATGWDQFGNRLMPLDVTWEATAEAGSINQDGTFVAANAAGVYLDGVRVTAASSDGDVTAFLDVSIVPGALAALILQGPSEQVVVGETTQLVAIAADAFGNQLPATATRWESSEQHQVTEDGSFTAGTTAGATTIGGSLTVDGVTVEAAVVVEVLPGPVVSFGIEPTVVTLAAGAEQRFVATASDEHGNAITGLEASWRTLTDAGTLDGQGEFVASTKPGRYGQSIEVSLTGGSSVLSASADVEVVAGPLSQVVVGPEAVELGIGMTQQLVALGGDRFGNPIRGLTFAWTATGGGSVDSSGLFTGGDIPGVFANALEVSATEGISTVVSTRNVTISPDQISFSATPTGSFRTQLFLTSVTGGEPVQAAVTPSISAYTWSPNGRRVAVAMDSTITVMDPAGEIREVVIQGDSSTNPATKVTQPAISPDGTQIAFVYSKSPLSPSGYPTYPWESTEIYVMDINGDNLRQVTDEPDVEKFDPAWSPDGTQIAYTHNTKPIQWDLWMVNADGTNNRAAFVAAPGALVNYPSWSPDGTKLLFRLWRTGGSANPSGSTDVGVADLKTGAVTLLTDDEESDYAPTWSEDGSQIAFYSNRAGGWDIFGMESDGTGLFQVTESEIEAKYPRWVPRRRGVIVDPDDLALATETD